MTAPADPVATMPAPVDEEIMNLMRLGAAVLSGLLYERYNAKFSLVIAACPQGETHVSLVSRCESDAVRQGIASVISDELLGRESAAATPDIIQ